MFPLPLHFYFLFNAWKPFLQFHSHSHFRSHFCFTFISYQHLKSLLFQFGFRSYFRSHFCSTLISCLTPKKLLFQFHSHFRFHFRSNFCSHFRSRFRLFSFSVKCLKAFSSDSFPTSTPTSAPPSFPVYSSLPNCRRPLNKRRRVHNPENQ